ncbi:hypothetical protein AURDEDRAFT_160427 [Auricularia subglabra TFB-10046 SS5]|nr:hypothetical protein AURDEDRAFT_160427 [Auricularia subglabra TFB-10046 SS5]
MSGPGAAQAAKEKARIRASELRIGPNVRVQGNAAFKAGDFVAAIGHYTDAALADRLEPTYPLNRAAAYLKLGKHADAERDCSTCLALSPGNVKALFRRAQARLALRKLDEAEKDLNDALKREPANDAVKQELAKLRNIRAQAAAPKKAPVSVAPPPLAGSSTSTTASKRRCIPIAIDRESDFKEAPPSTSTPTARTSHTPPDLLTPVSSRPLGKNKDVPSAASQPAPLKSILKLPHQAQIDSSPMIEASRPAARNSTPEPSSSAIPSRAPPVDRATSQGRTTPAGSSPATFAEASQARTRRVGGGIFRQNGTHELFKNSDGDTLADGRPAPVRETRTLLSQPVDPGKARATTLFALQREWTNQSAAAARWELLCTVPPSTLPALCKNLLEPAFLVAILETFHELAEIESVQPAIRDYMSWLATVSRFDTVVMFLSAREREIAQEVLRTLGMKSWAGISV